MSETKKAKNERDANEFTTDAEYIDGFIMPMLKTGQFIPVWIDDNGSILGPDEPIIGDTDMRERMYYKTVIGQVDPLTIQGEQFEVMEFVTKHDYAASVLFWPFLSDVIRCMQPSVVMEIKKAYVAVNPGFGDKSFTDDGMHYGTATVFYQM